jgi:hypothetical protein
MAQIVVTGRQYENKKALSTQMSLATGGLPLPLKSTSPLLFKSVIWAAKRAVLGVVLGRLAGRPGAVPSDVTTC